MTTKKEALAELEALGVEGFTMENTWVELTDALHAANAAYEIVQAALTAEYDPVDPETVEKPTVAVTFAVDGRCRQCARPADHIHEGV
jgi:hypothetical protein